MKSRFEGLQSKMQRIGSDGCYFLALMSIVEEQMGEHFDVLNAYDDCVRQHIIQDDCYVLDAVKLIATYCNTSRVNMRIVKNLDSVVIKDNVYTIAVWHNPRTGYKHFRRRGFDTLDHSTTVEEGRIIEYRVFTIEPEVDDEPDLFS